MCVYVLSHFSRVILFVSLWTITHQAPLTVRSSRQQYWSWVAISLAKGSSQFRDGTHVSCISCIGRQILYH